MSGTVVLVVVIIIIIVIRLLLIIVIGIIIIIITIIVLIMMMMITIISSSSSASLPCRAADARLHDDHQNHNGTTFNSNISVSASTTFGVEERAEFRIKQDYFVLLMSYSFIIKGVTTTQHGITTLSATPQTLLWLCGGSARCSCEPATVW